MFSLLQLLGTREYSDIHTDWVQSLAKSIIQINNDLRAMKVPLNQPGVILVGATDRQNKRLALSNYGSSEHICPVETCLHSYGKG